MAHYWNIKNKRGVIVDPVIIDEQICKALNINPDPVKYVNDWWDLLGIILINGKTTQQVYEESLSSTFATRKDQIIWQILSEYNGEAWYRR
jgi:hypothetical protein